MLKTDELAIPRAAFPEEVGVSSKAVAAFLDDIEKSGMNIHTFMIIRHGKVAAECYRAPFTAQRPHAMYSVSKTFTATAIGLALSEKLFSIDDRVRDFFPDYTDKIEDSRLDGLTIRHLLTMTSGKNPSVFYDKSAGSWIEYFFEAPWYADPGAEFRYINENIYMLCAIINRVTKMSVREYLKPRLFDPLGIDYPFWETDPYGIEAGGWGLYLKTEDLAKLMLCYEQGGRYNGRQVLPEEWTKFASSKLADNSSEKDADACVGYGCCLWRCAGANAYRADGLFSQFGIVFEDCDAVLAVTSSVADNQSCRDFLWKHFPAMFINDKAAKTDTAFPCLAEKLANAVLEAPAKLSESDFEKLINNSNIRFRKQLLLNLIGFPLSILPLPVTYMAADKAGNINNMSFSFDNAQCSMTWSEGDETNTVPAGMDGKFRYGVMRLGQIDYKVCCSAQWLDRNRLFMQIHPYETVGKRTLDLTFKNSGRVIMKPSSSPDLYSILMSLASLLDLVISSQKLRDIIIYLVRFAPDVLEPKHRGRIHYNKLGDS